MNPPEHYTEPRTKLVVKDNALIQNSEFSLSTRQQKIMSYLISQITPYDNDFQTYEFSIKEFCRVYGINPTSGNNMEDIKAAIQKLADKSTWFRIDGKETLLRWIEKATIDHKSGLIYIRLDNDMKPFLLQRTKNFTRYELVWTIFFQNKHTQRLYELIKSVHYHDLEIYQRSFTLEELRRRLGAENLTTWQRLKERALEPAISEINAFSDKTLSYIPIKKGRSIVAVELTIATKSDKERLQLIIDIEKKFDINQLLEKNPPD